MCVRRQKGPEEQQRCDKTDVLACVASRDHGSAHHAPAAQCQTILVPAGFVPNGNAITSIRPPSAAWSGCVPKPASGAQPAPRGSIRTPIVAASWPVRFSTPTDPPGPPQTTEPEGAVPPACRQMRAPCRRESADDERDEYEV